MAQILTLDYRVVTYLSEEPEDLEGPVKRHGVEKQGVGMSSDATIERPGVEHFDYLLKRTY